MNEINNSKRKELLEKIESKKQLSEDDLKEIGNCLKNLEPLPVIRQWISESENRFIYLCPVCWNKIDLDDYNEGFCKNCSHNISWAKIKEVK